MHEATSIENILITKEVMEIAAELRNAKAKQEGLAPADWKGSQPVENFVAPALDVFMSRLKLVRQTMENRRR